MHLVETESTFDYFQAISRRMASQSPFTATTTASSISKKPRSKAALRASTKTGTVAAVPDRRAMESFLAALSGYRRDDATAKAQDVMSDAWERTTSRSRIALAQKALGISPLCADAYVLLAEEARSLGSASIVSRLKAGACHASRTIAIPWASSASFRRCSASSPRLKIHLAIRISPRTSASWPSCQASLRRSNAVFTTSVARSTPISPADRATPRSRDRARRLQSLPARRGRTTVVVHKFFRRGLVVYAGGEKGMVLACAGEFLEFDPKRPRFGSFRGI